MAGIVERMKIVSGGNQLINASQTIDRVSMKNYAHLTVIIDIVPASGTDTAAVTLKQSKTVDDSPSTEKALSFTYMWKCADASASDTLVKTAVVSDTFSTSATAKHEVFVMEIESAMLDTANDFDCVRVNITDPGSVSTPTGVTYILSEPRFASGSPAGGPSAIVD